MTGLLPALSPTDLRLAPQLCSVICSKNVGYPIQLLLKFLFLVFTLSLTPVGIINVSARNFLLPGFVAITGEDDNRQTEEAKLWPIGRRLHRPPAFRPFRLLCPATWSIISWAR